ncbi:MAG: DNA mismatch repair protein MutS [archaeon]|nr:DNA mismatch repair protein MutS [archaeon]
MSKPTPMLAQYHDMKKRYPDCVIAFRMGDFYEMFFEDAKIASDVLNITLTKRGTNYDGKPIPLAGIPHHAFEPYFAKLIKAGYKVAVAEQMEDPKMAKGLVKRDVIRVITPGTVLSSNMLDAKENNYIAAVHKKDKRIGMAVADISTGEFLVSEFGSYEDFINEISRFSPKEIIVEEALFSNNKFYNSLKSVNNSVRISPYLTRNFMHYGASETLKEHFRVASLEGFGVGDCPVGVSAAGALMTYLKETQMTALSHINSMQIHKNTEFMTIDPVTLRNLEIVRNIRENTARGTLLETIDRTLTAMGSRMLVSRLLKPLLDPLKINQRLDAVEELLGDYILKENIRDTLKETYDIERIISRIVYGTANARDLLGLKKTLELIPVLKKHLGTCTSGELKKIRDMKDMGEIHDMIDAAISDDPPLSVREGRIIKEGFNKELDELRYLSSNAKEWVGKYEQEERRRTGIKSLKVRFNKVFGYFIEVTRANIHMAPETYIRKQTMVNGERFITEELKEKEAQILGAEEKIVAMEYEIFMKLVADISKFTGDIQHAAKNIALLDFYSSLSHVAHENNYARPKIDDSGVIDVKDARHPVVEKMTDSYITNDVYLDSEKSRLVIITGPNMAGKSTYMRSVALIALLAQAGSFVPAGSARIGVVDRIFTRIGAYDDLTMGQSTFMIEMNETANILNNATDKSLIILDEIGRGTSTFDGLSIAWSCAEYIHEAIGAKTLFATHFHQLNVLEDEMRGVKNYHMTAKEEGDTILFLRKLVEGGTDKSYGVQVAQLSGLPRDVIERAKKIQEGLEKEDFRMIKDYKLAPREQKKLVKEKSSKKDEKADKRLKEKNKDVQRTLF